MIFQISLKLSVAKDLPQTYRQTVPQMRLATAKLLLPNLLWVRGTVDLLNNVAVNLILLVF